MSDLVPLSLATDESRFGGKAANLARLLAAGVPTAPGVVVPSEALDAHLHGCNLPPLRVMFERWLAMDIKQAQVQAEAFRTRILFTPPPVDVAAAITVHCAAQVSMASAPPRLAVRSSGVGEDGNSASFAGMFDTRLNVAGIDAALNAIRDVWASLLGRRVLAYAHHRQICPGGMAVILQAQVEALMSGVMFTRDPRPGAPAGPVAEYCTGLGEHLVSGAVTPSRVRIAADTGALTLEQQSDDFRPLPEGTGQQLAVIAQHLEIHFGGPQDIEWSITDDGRVIVLQSRPITTPTGLPDFADSPAGSAPAPAADGGDQAPLHVWTNANVAENYPAPICPLLRSFVARGYAAYFRGLGIAFGISRRRITAMHGALENLVGTHAGRLYYNLSHIHTVLHLAPGGSWLARFFNQFTGAGEFPPPVPVQSSPLGRWIEIARVAVKVPWRYSRVQRHLARFEHAVDQYAEATTPAALARADTAELAARLRGFLQIRLERWTDAALADTAAMVCYGLLAGLLGRWLPQRDQIAIQNDLLKGLPGLASAVPVEKLWELSRRIRGDATLHALFRDATPDAVLAALQTPDHADFRVEFEAYLARWGFRYSGELMLTQPTPQEYPQPVIRLLQSYVREDGEGPVAASAVQTGARLAVTAEIEQVLTPNRLLRLLPCSRAGCVRWVLRATQGSIRLRERARMKQALLYTRLRLVALALGDRLVADGRLRQRDDAFYLTTDELLALASSPDTTRADAALRRRADEARWLQLTPPDHFMLPAGTEWLPEHGSPAASSATGDELQGSAACGGVVTGQAVVVLDVAEADRIRSGQILVTRQTDPGWAAVFFLIKGLVIERGGMLSHGAIIAREYGIPAVVGVRDATRLINDGDTIAVDGNLGKVNRCVV